ncbi:DUF2066 domain-containing protein [Pelagibacteraceae bacterium]|nr:DUF2066 domain-containing protein [Pelagibacteraceae bacterium]
MKNLVFICSILIILFKTGNVLSDNNIFNVNNIEINKEISKNKEKLVNTAFQKAFDQLINRLLLKEDHIKLVDTDLREIKNLISYYQIINQDNNNANTNTMKINVFFDKDRMHNFFYNRNILYSDIVNTEVVLFPLLKKDDQYFIYTKNYFYENWNEKKLNNLIQYVLPGENIENIEKINKNKNNIFELEISDFFKEYEVDNIAFINIEIKKFSAEIFLSTRISGKKINKNLSIENKKNLLEEDFYNSIILEINNIIGDLIKSQNLIDVRTPSFLNVEIKLNDKSNLIEFNNRLKKIDLIDNFYVQQLNKDYVLVKIKYLGKINKIIKKLDDQNISLKLIAGQWQLKII